MIEKEDFPILVERAMAMPGCELMRPVIEKELLHYDILFILDSEGLLDKLTFQGGTALRLCYGAQRFSEDLDFAGGNAFISQDLHAMKACIEHYIGKRYGLEVSVKEPKDLQDDPVYQDIKVNKWQINITVSPEKKDIPRQKIKIEVANINAYSRAPLPLQENYPFLPDGYGDILVLVESLDEIMADKLIAFVNCTRYIRYRDIWDLRWLKQQGAKINLTYIRSKITDYHIEDYLMKLDHRIDEMEAMIRGSGFKAELSRFIPFSLYERTLKKDKFQSFLIAEMRGLLKETRLF